MNIASATVADRVKETTSTIGTGTVTLAGPMISFTSFAVALGTGPITTFYCILSGNGIDWEVGQGVFTSSGTNTLTRPAANVLASSNSGNLINLTGSSIVFCDVPAAWANPMTKIGIPAMYLAATALFGGL